MRNPLTIEAFADWCETKPSIEHYHYWSNNCAVGQFLSHAGIEVECVGGTTWTPKGFPVGAMEIPSAMVDPLAYAPHTFGALAARLRSNQGAYSL